MKWRKYDEWRNTGLAAWKDRAAELWPETAVFLDQIVDPDQFTLARYGQHTLSTPYAAGRIVAGLISGTITNPLPRIGIDPRSVY